MNIENIFLMLLTGLVLKIIDDIYDRGILPRDFGLLLSVLAVPLGIWLMLDIEGFILVGAIFWTTLFRGKVDNPGFRTGYLLTAAIWALSYLYLTPFPMDPGVLASLGICILSIVLTTVFHDLFKRSPNQLWDILIEERFMIVILDAPALLLGVVTPTGMVGILVLVGGYSIGGKVSKVIESRNSRRKIIYSE